MRITKKIIVLVNAYSTSKYMPHHFIANGYQCLHVATSQNVGKAISHQVKVDTNNFIECIQMQDNSEAEVQRVVELLQKYDIKAILPGSESSIFITDRIASYFPVKKNNKETSIIRRHKYHMIEAIRTHGLAAQKQMLSKSADDVVEWFVTEKLHKIVIKPPLSTGSDNVFVCYNINDIKNYFPQVHQNKNVYGVINEEVVAQEFIEGEEYIVNSVSRDGKHFVIDAWHGITLHDGDLVSHDYADLVPFDSEVYHQLVSYLNKSLDALGIENGPGHSEIRINENGIYLIECGARLAGAIDPSAVIEAIGYNHLSIFAESVLNPVGFFKRINEQQERKGLQRVRYVYFSPKISGVLKQEPDFSEIVALPTINHLYFSKQVGDHINLAAEISDIHGYCYLIADAFDDITTDYQHFKQAEEKLYQKCL